MEDAKAGIWNPPSDDTACAALARRVGHLWLRRLERRAKRLRTTRLRRQAHGFAERLGNHLDADILRAEGNLDGYLARLSGRVAVRR
jgi:hypothetical protein